MAIVIVNNAQEASGNIPQTPTANQIVAATTGISLTPCSINPLLSSIIDLIKIELAVIVIIIQDSLGIPKIIISEKS